MQKQTPSIFAPNNLLAAQLQQQLLGLVRSSRMQARGRILLPVIPPASTAPRLGAVLQLDFTS